MQTDPRPELLDQTIAFRATGTMWDAVEAHRLARRLEKFSDAAREVLAAGLVATSASESIAPLATELRRLGGDPEQALRTAIAAMEEPVVTTSPRV